jgi:hypothetical protein
MKYEHFKLDKYTRNASFGNNYILLKRINENWSSELHRSGNVMDNEKLSLIAKEGIIRWYCDHCLDNLDLDYPVISRLTILRNKIEDIHFYDWINIIKFANFFNIERIIFSDYIFNKGWKFHFINNKFPKNFEYNFMSMGKIILLHYSREIIVQLIDEIIKNAQLIKSYYENETLFQTFFEKNKDIINFGIAFQRLKIILEKMPIKSLTNDTNIESSLANPDIYKFDKLCDDIQECIYSWIKNYFYNIKKNGFVRITKDDLPIDYLKVIPFLEKINDSDIYKIRY